MTNSYIELSTKLGIPVGKRFNGCREIYGKWPQVNKQTKVKITGGKEIVIRVHLYSGSSSAFDNGQSHSSHFHTLKLVKLIGVDGMFIVYSPLEDTLYYAKEV